MAFFAYENATTGRLTLVDIATGEVKAENVDRSFIKGEAISQQVEIGDEGDLGMPREEAIEKPFVTQSDFDAFYARIQSRNMPQREEEMDVRITVCRDNQVRFAVAKNVRNYFDRTHFYGVMYKEKDGESRVYFDRLDHEIFKKSCSFSKYPTGRKTQTLFIGMLTRVDSSDQRMPDRIKKLHETESVKKNLVIWRNWKWDEAAGRPYLDLSEVNADE